MNVFINRVGTITMSPQTDRTEECSRLWTISCEKTMTFTEFNSVVKKHKDWIQVMNYFDRTFINMDHFGQNYEKY